jgi:hypothetical protein
MQNLLWSAVASPTLKAFRTTPIFKVGLQQGFEAGEMGKQSALVPRFAGGQQKMQGGRKMAE